MEDFVGGGIRPTTPRLVSPGPVTADNSIYAQTLGVVYTARPTGPGTRVRRIR